MTRGTNGTIASTAPMAQAAYDTDRRTCSRRREDTDQQPAAGLLVGPSNGNETPAWLRLSRRQLSGRCRRAAALVLAIQELVANGGGRPSRRRRRSAASPGRT